MYTEATDDLGRTFKKGDHITLTGFNTNSESSPQTVLNSIFGMTGYVYSLEWTEPRVSHTLRHGLYLRGGWDITIVDAPDAKPETGLVTRWKQGEDGGQIF